MLAHRFKDDAIIEIGIDEAGRGSFWGPIMAGAVIIPDKTTWTDRHCSMLLQIRDSKKVSIKKREKIAEEIKELIAMGVSPRKGGGKLPDLSGDGKITRKDVLIEDR